MRFVFLFFAIGLASIVYSGLGLAWDGAYQLAYTLENQFVIAPYGRYTQVPILVIVLALSRRSDSSFLLSWTFQAMHALLPLFALIASWVIVRSRRPELFVWIAFGIGLATLPAQACLVCQSIGTVQLGWILFAAIATGMTRKGAIFTTIAIPLMLFHHPVAIILFTIATGFAFVSGIVSREMRSHLWRWACLFLVVTLVAIARMWLNQSEYESSKLGRDAWDTAWNLGVAGLPLQMVGFTWLAAVSVMAELYAGKLRMLVRCVVFAAIGTALLLLYVWGRDAQVWASAIEYRNWSVWLSIPLFILLILDVKRADIAFRRRVTQLTSVGFAVVLLVQSAAWIQLTERLRFVMETSQDVCIEARHIEGLPRTALGGWTITSYALLMQGKQPQTLVYFWESCNQLDFSRGYWLANIGPWDYHSWNSGWFDKRLLGQRIISNASR